MKFLALFVAFTLAVCAHGAALTGGQTDVSSLCLKCLCEGSTSGCDHGAQCDSYGFCGPFRISENYWREAGSFENDFKKCANNYDCAEKTVKAYMQKFGKDCDGDGDVDCLDFALIHHKGRNGCPYQDYASDSLYKFVDGCIRRAPQDAQVLRQDTAQSMKNKEHENLEKSHPESGETMENIKEGGEHLRSKAHETGENLRKNVEDQAENVEHEGRNIGEKVKDSLKSAKDNVQEKFRGAKESVQEKFQSGKEGIQEGVQSAKDSVSDKARQISGTSEDAARNIGDTSSQLAKDAEHQGERLQDKLRSDDMMQHKEHSSSGASSVPEVLRQRRAALRY